MDENAWSHELSLFAKDLFANLMSRHPLLHMLPRIQGGSRYFTGEMGKCVMLKWHEIRTELDKKLRKDFPKFVKKEDCFKQYLRLFVDVVIQSEHNVMNQVFSLSAVLLGILCFVFRRGKTHFAHDASNYLLYMLFNVKPEEFYAGGGWTLLATVSKRLSEGYDEKEICRQYLLENACNCNASNLTVTSKIDSTVKHSSEIANGITEKTFQEAVAISGVLEKEPGEDSAKQNSTICGTSSAIKSLCAHKPPIIPREKSSEILVSESLNTEPKKAKGESMKKEKNLENQKLLPLEQAEIHQVVSESIKTSEKEPPVRESSFKEESGSLEKLTERRMCDIREQSISELSKPTAKYIKNGAVGTKHENANDGAKKNYSNQIKSPGPETSKSSTPIKAKTPSSEKYSIRDVKSKTEMPTNNGKSTPLKTPTTRTPKTRTPKTPTLVPSTGKNNTERLTPKLLKPDSVEPKSKSPVCPKTPTDKEPPKFQLKSSEKKDRNQRLPLPKDSQIVTKSSPRSVSESVGNAKSSVKDLPTTHLSKPLPPAIPKSKWYASNPPSNQLKSSSTTSSLVPKCKGSSKGASSVCEKAKKLQSSNLKTENVKEGTSLEKPLAISSAKSDDPERKSDKPYKGSSNNKSDAEETSSQARKCEENKGNKPPIASTRSANNSNACRTRNVPVKSASGDSKNEKPRWR